MYYVFLAGQAMTGDSANRSESPLDFLVYMGLLSVQGSASLISGAFWGEREGWCVFWFCDSLLSKGPLISIVYFFFFPLTIKLWGDVTPQVTVLPLEMVPTQDGHLWSYELSSPPFLFPLYPSVRLVFCISTLRVEISFWRWLLPPDSLLWPGFCWFQMFVSSLCINWSFCAPSPGYAIGRAGLMGTLPCISTRPCSEGAECSVITVLKFLIISSLSLCFVSEVWWHAGHALGPWIPSSCMVLPPSFILPPPYLSTFPGLVQPPAPAPGLWPLPLSGRGSPVAWAGGGLCSVQSSRPTRGAGAGEVGIRAKRRLSLSLFVSVMVHSVGDSAGPSCLPLIQVQSVSLAHKSEFLAGCQSGVVGSDRPLGRGD